MSSRENQIRMEPLLSSQNDDDMLTVTEENEVNLSDFDQMNFANPNTVTSLAPALAGTIQQQQQQILFGRSGKLLKRSAIPSSSFNSMDSMMRKPVVDSPR